MAINEKMLAKNKDGFSVQIVADGQDVIDSVIEYETEEAAIENVKKIDDAGHHIAFPSGKFLTCYGVDRKNGTVKDILSSILAGEAIKKQSMKCQFERRIRI